MPARRLRVNKGRLNMAGWRHGLSCIILKDALKADGCPICTLLVSGMRKYFYWFLYESVNDAYIRKRLIESRGYCHTHAWQLFQIEQKEWADSLGAAIIYQELVKKATQSLEESKPKRKWALFSIICKWASGISGKSAEELKNPKLACPACLHQRQMEENWVSSLIQSLAFPEFQELYRASYGLCLHHLEKALNATQDKTIRKFLLSTQRGKIERLSELLAEYIRKHDYRFADEPKGEEVNSTRWAIEMFVGKPRW